MYRVFEYRSDKSRRFLRTIKMEFKLIAFWTVYAKIYVYHVFYRKLKKKSFFDSDFEFKMHLFVFKVFLSIALFWGNYQLISFVCFLFSKKRFIPFWNISLKAKWISYDLKFGEKKSSNPKSTPTGYLIANCNFRMRWYAVGIHETWKFC